MDGIDGLVTGSFIIIFIVISNGSVDLIFLLGLYQVSYSTIGNHQKYLWEMRVVYLLGVFL